MHQYSSLQNKAAPKAAMIRSVSGVTLSGVFVRYWLPSKQLASRNSYHLALETNSC